MVVPSRNALKKVAFSRDASISKLLFDEFLESQRSEQSKYADVHLICEDGLIQAHGFLLQAASSFFERAIASQGDSYIQTRNILMPDYSVLEMRKVIQLIYSGHVQIDSEAEAKSIKDTLQYLRVTNIKQVKAFEPDDKPIVFYLTKRGGLPSGDKQAEATQDKNNSSSMQKSKSFPAEKQSKADNDEGSDKMLTDKSKQSSSKGTAEEPRSRRSLRPRKSTKKLVDSDDSDSDYEPDNSDVSTSVRKRFHSPGSSSENVNRSPSKAGHKSSNSTSNAPSSSRSGGVMPRVVVERTAAVPPQAQGKQIQNAPVRRLNNVNNNHQDGDDEEEPESDEWDEPDYADRTWFDREARRCQKCHKEHTSPAQASLCITSHQRLRCYFCFTVCKNTEKLFEHFKKKHKQAGRENCLMCPYCEQTIPFKSVSCHVISMHLSENKQKGTNAEHSNQQGRYSAGSNNAVHRIGPGPGRPPSSGRPSLQPVGHATVAGSSGAGSSKSSKASDKDGQSTSSGGITGPAAKKKRSVWSDDDDSESDVPQEEKKKPPKKDDGMLRVGDLDVTIKKRCSNGKVRVYELTKDRSA